jgi:uncharacterized surface protein with fasciclin (FAS1) repeats
MRVLSVLLVTALAIMAAPFTSASAQQDAEPAQTIAEVALATPELSTLVTALSAATDSGPVDFLGTVSDPAASLTVFAPTNDAFAALGDTLNAALADPSGLLTDVLLYHVLGSEQSSRDLIDAGAAATLLGQDVQITIGDDGAVYINQAQVLLSDIQASNGVVHVIDAVLLPGAPDPEPQTIVDIAVATPELSTLVDALTLATTAGGFDFVGAASNPDADLTVFAPTNAAFEALGAETLNAVLSDPAGALTDILSYHVLGTGEDAAALLAAGQATTLLGQDVTIEFRDDGNVYINDSQVVIADIQASNGIVHVIDAVLLPAPASQTIAEIAVATPELSTLVTALSTATDSGPVDFLGAVSNPDADLTVFAPTNAAFDALGTTLGAALADPSGLLTEVLSYHVLGQSQDAAALLAAGEATTLLGENVTISLDETGNVLINNSVVTIANIEASNGIVHVIDAVLLPPVPPTIAEIAVATPELSTLVAALTAATDSGPIDFLGVASDPNADLTVFAPTNDAFAALGDTLGAALADPSGLLTDVLSYHVLGESQAAADLLSAGQATTLLGQDVTIEIRDDGNVYINDSQVVIADIEASNGIVHVIDAVLLPAAAPESPVFDGAQVNIISAVSGRYLDGDRGWWRTNVDTSFYPRLDTEWILEETGQGTWRLQNARLHLYLDADGRRRGYNVDLGRRHFRGTEWEITELDNGNYVLRSAAFDRNLDFDWWNVDTSSNLQSDNEWQIVIAAGH